MTEPIPVSGHSASCNSNCHLEAFAWFLEQLVWFLRNWIFHLWCVSCSRVLVRHLKPTQSQRVEILSIWILLDSLSVLASRYSWFAYTLSAVPVCLLVSLFFRGSGMSSVFCNLQHSFSPRAFLSLRFRTEGGILLLWHRVPYTIVCSWLYEGIYILRSNCVTMEITLAYTWLLVYS